MPANSAGGTPYALPADPLVQWPATSQSVALKVDEKVKKSGDTMTGSLGVVATGSGPVDGAALHIAAGPDGKSLTRFSVPGWGGNIAMGDFDTRADEPVFRFGNDNNNLMALVAADPVHPSEVVTRGWAEPNFQYAFSTESLEGAAAGPTPAFYFPARIALTGGRWLIQAQLRLQQKTVSDVSYVAVGLEGVGIDSRTTGAGVAIDASKDAVVTSALGMVSVPAGATSYYFPAWFQNGSSKADVMGGVLNGPVGVISAIRIAGL